MPMGEGTKIPPGRTTLLMYACSQGDLPQVKRLLHDQPNSATTRDRTLKTALHYCAGGGALTSAGLAHCADLLVMAAPSLVETRDEDGFTPLHLAVISGNMQLVTFLLANGADVHALDTEKHSVVHWATVCGETTALGAVLSAGAQVSTPDVHGGFPLHYAAQMCGSEKDQLGLQVLHILLAQPGASVAVQDNDGRQPLLWAASAGSARAVLALVRAGALVEAPDRDGLTALHCAASRGHTDCLDTLLTLCGATPDVIDSNGCTALHYSVTLGHADATALLLTHGADPNRQDRKGRSPAHCGCAKGQLETVKQLGAHGANLWLRNARGDLPLHEAAGSGRRQLVRWLLDQRPSQVNARNNDGRCPLHLAALNDNADMCKILLDGGAQINPVLRTSKNAFMTPLDCALQRGFRSTAKFLQLHGGVPASRLSGSIQLGSEITASLGASSIHIREDIAVGSSSEDLDDIQKKTVRRKSVRKRVSYRYERKRSADLETDLKLERKVDVLRKANDSRTVKPIDIKSNGKLFRKKHKDDESQSELTSPESQNLKRNDKTMKKVEETPTEESEQDESSSETDVAKHHKKKSKLGESKTHKKKSKADEEPKHKEHKKKTKVKEDEVSDEEESKPKPSKKKTRLKEDTEESSEVEPPKKEHKKKAKSKEDSGEQLDEIDVKKVMKGKKTKTEKKKTDSESEKTRKESSDSLEREKKSIKKSCAKEELIQEQEEVKPEEAIPEEVDVENLNAATVDDEQAIAELSENEDVEVVEETVEESAVPDNTEEPETTIDTKGLEVPAEQSVVDEEQVKKSEDFLEESIQPDQISLQSKLSEESPSKTIVVTASVHEPPKETQEELATPDAPTEEPEAPAEEPDAPAEEPEELKQEDAAKPEETELTSEEQQTIVSVDDSTMDLKSHEAMLSSGETLTMDDAKEIPVDEATVLVPDGHEAPEEELKDIEEDSKEQLDTVELKGEYETIEELPPEASKKGTELNIDLSLKKFEETAGLQEDTYEQESTKVKKYRKKVKIKGKSTKLEDSSTDQTKTDLKLNESSSASRETSSDSEQTDLKEHKSFKVLKEDVAFEILKDTRRTKRKSKKATPESATSSPDAAEPNRCKSLNREPDDILPPLSETKQRPESNMSAPNLSSVYSDNEQKSGSNSDAVEDDVISSASRKRRFRRRAKRTGTKSAGSDYESSNLIDSGFEPSPRSSRIPKRKVMSERGVNMTTVTQQIQGNIRRYHMERKIFQHLLDLKRLQIRSGQTNENVLVKRAIDNYHNSVAASVGAGRYLKKDYSYKSFEQFLYQSLRMLQKSPVEHLKGLPQTPDNPLFCTQSTHRCLHATHAYTGIPCAAYIPKMNHHTIPKIGFNPRSSASFLPQINSKGKSVTLELCHGNDKQVISLPADRLDHNKRYYVTFTVKGQENQSIEDQSSTHRHAKSV